MKNKTIILFVFFSFILSLFINAEEKRILSEQEKEYYIDRMIDIISYYYHDNPEFLENLKVYIRMGKSYEIEKGKNLIKCGFYNYDKEKKERIAFFKFEFADRKLIYFKSHDCYENFKKRKGENIEKKINEKQLLKLVRIFCNKFIPQFDDDYFLRLKTDTLFNFEDSKIYDGIYFYIYYKGYKTTDSVSFDYYLDGKLKTYYLFDEYDYKVPKKILTWEEALEQLKNEINRDPKKYYNIESFADIKVLTDEELKKIQKEKYYMYPFNKFYYLDKKPIFLNANTEIGKYLKEGAHGIFGGNDIMKIKERWNRYFGNKNPYFTSLGDSKFKKLAYIFYINADLRDNAEDFGLSELYVDAETGEIIGGRTWRNNYF